MAGDRREIGHEGAGEWWRWRQPGRVKVGDRVTVMPQYPCGNCALVPRWLIFIVRIHIILPSLRGAAMANVRLPIMWSSLQAFVADSGEGYGAGDGAIDGIGASFGGMQAIGDGYF